LKGGFSRADLSRARRETPGCEEVVHFNNAGGLAHARAGGGCHPDEIAVVENTTRAWDLAFYSIPLGPGDRILTAMAEYASNYIAYLQLARRSSPSPTKSMASSPSKPSNRTTGAKRF
jgi:hypothetical protein